MKNARFLEIEARRYIEAECIRVILRDVRLSTSTVPLPLRLAESSTHSYYLSQENTVRYQ
jgi:hypothetical protein